MDHLSPSSSLARWLETGLWGLGRELHGLFSRAVCDRGVLEDTDASLSYPCRRTMEAAALTPHAKAQATARGHAPAKAPTLWETASPAEPASAW